MKAVRTKNTAPEVAVRSLLHRLGYRFRLHPKNLPGTPDIVLPGRLCAIFVHGCFWHGHGCRIGRASKSKLSYWGPKLAANKRRDIQKEGALRRQGWRVAIVWQCELDEPFRLVVRLMDFLDG